MDKHDTVGIDCVAMCVNDIVCCGAKPLFFLDYIAIGKNVPEKVAAIVSGVAEGCVQAGCALIGGETAEHPGIMAPEDYDLAGFSVGIVDKAKVMDHSAMRPGDVVLALPSSGLHSNGFSLVRKVFDVEHADLGAHCADLGQSLGEALLTPTRIYVKPVLAALAAAEIRGISHITGGGFYENIPRCLPEGLTAKIEKAALRMPPIFPLLQKTGSIPERDMFNTFNMRRGHGGHRLRAPAPDKALSALRDRRLRGLSHRRDRPGRGAGGLMLNTCPDRRAGLRRRHQSGGAAALPGAGQPVSRGDRAGVCQPSRGLRPDPGRQPRRPRRGRHTNAAGARSPLRLRSRNSLLRCRADLIVLAGFLSILSEDFVRRWPDRIVNIHPSLIPSFCGKGYYGLRVHEAALERGVKVTGATVHLVNEIPDGGRILLQKAVEILPGDTPEILQRRVMEQAEWVLLPQAVEMLCKQISEEGASRS